MKLYKLYEEVLREEYDNGILYGYHVTSMGFLDSIKRYGFKVGSGQMQGKGVYSFYDFKHAKGYASKEISHDIIVKFVITNPSPIIILNTEIAKEVLGSEYHLRDQVNRYSWDGVKGLNGFLKLAKMVYKKDITLDELIEELNYIEENNSESNQRIFWSYMIPSRVNGKLNILLNNNYGIEYRINRVNIMTPIGYYFKGEYISFEDDVIIPDTDEYDELRKYLSNYDDKLLALIEYKQKLEGILNNVKSNREWDKIQGLIGKIDKSISKQR